jgi:hypothetical protein
VIDVDYPSTVENASERVLFVYTRFDDDVQSRHAQPAGEATVVSHAFASFGTLVAQ